MKKKFLIFPFVVAPLLLFTACNTTQSVVLEANWFADTTRKGVPENFSERLEYAISFEKSVSEGGRFFVDYSEGTYKTELRTGMAEGKMAFIYSTELRINAQYTLDGKSSEKTEDVVTSEVAFLGVQDELKPIYARREANVTAPLSTAFPGKSVTSVDQAYLKYRKKTETVYDYANNQATYSVYNLESEETATKPEVKKFNLGVKGLYFDNEMLFPLLRAATLSSSTVLYVIDAETGTMEKVSVKEGPAQTTLAQSVKFFGDEAATERNFNASEFSLGFAKTNSGGSQKFTIANRTHAENNVNRNVVLKYSYPVIFSHGTLSYRLISATFGN